MISKATRYFDAFSQSEFEELLYWSNKYKPKTHDWVAWLIIGFENGLKFHELWDGYMRYDPRYEKRNKFSVYQGFYKFFNKRLKQCSFYNVTKKHLSIDSMRLGILPDGQYIHKSEKFTGGAA